MPNFPDRLKELRITRHGAQIRLTELMTIGPRVYSPCKTGHVTQHFETIVRPAGAPCVSFDELTGRKALVIVLGSLVKRSRAGKVMADL
jgi:hypothetical protein